MKVLEGIPVKLDVDEVVRRLLGGKAPPAMREKIGELLEIIEPVMNPQALYTVSYIDRVDGDTVFLGEHGFTSRVLRINLEDVGRVFPYVVTAGGELDKVELPKGQSTMFLEQVKAIVVTKAFQHFRTELAETYRIGKLSSMSPGRLDEWAITQQRELFGLFGSHVDEIGVHLTETCLMVPLNTVSGILFTSEIAFESCQLCPRERCTGRRARFDPELVKKYGIEA